jgi:hypothetical protein
MRAPQQKGRPLPVPLSPPVSAKKTPASAEGGERNGPLHRPLAVTFRHDGFGYRQIAREGDGAIYEQSKGGKVRAFEVIRIRRRAGFEIEGRTVEPAEVYPASEQWGTDGWTLPTLARALEKLKEITS